MGKLYFIYGTMGSAKTASLLTKAYNFEEKGINFICMKPSIDTREGKSVIKSRIGIERECILIKPDEPIHYLVCMNTNIKTLKWILIDESQFLSEEQVDDLAKMVDEYDLNVFCYGLRTDFQTKLFPGSKRLFEIADTIEEVKSTCECGHKSIVNARIDETGKVITKGDQVEIGGNDKYVAMCRKCWHNSTHSQFNI